MQLPRDLVYFARTAALIEGLGARYDRDFNALTFAAPVALGMRRQVMAALGERPTAGTPLGALDAALPDWAADVGAALGEVAGVVTRAGREIAGVLQLRLGPLLGGLERGLTDAVAELARPDLPRERPPAPRPLPALLPGEAAAAD